MDAIQDFVLLVEDGEDRVTVEIGKQTENLDLSDGLLLSDYILEAHQLIDVSLTELSIQAKEREPPIIIHLSLQPVPILRHVIVISSRAFIDVAPDLQVIAMIARLFHAFGELLELKSGVDVLFRVKDQIDT